MIRKIIVHGNQILKQEGEFIDNSYEGLSEVISDMFETMDGAKGIGLAAQQIGLPIKLFVLDLDLSHHGEKDASLKGFRKVFINSEIIESSEETFSFEEGCLSFPGIYVTVTRPRMIRVLYQDENFVEHEEWLGGIAAIAFQHEHDHTEGVVFIDHASQLKRKMISKSLSQIMRADIASHYPMKFK